MSSNDEEFSIEVVDSNLDLAGLVAEMALDDDLKERVAGAKILFLPTDLSPENPVFAFPDSTREIFRYFQTQLNDTLAVEAVVADDNYTEFAFLSETITLPLLYVTSITVLPLAINLLGSFIYDKLKTLGVSNPADTVEAEIAFPDSNGNVRSLKYRGPAATFEKVVPDFIKQTDELNQRNV